MNIEYNHLLPEDFPPTARVWIYQASRLLGLSEAFLVEEKLEEFCAKWLSHGAKVAAKSFVFFGQFIVLVADETAVPVGGCSTDSSVHFLQALEKEIGISLFDRMSLAFVVKDKVEVIPLSQLSYALENQFISGDTLFFNNSVTSLDALRENWLIPVKESWISKRYAVASPA